MQRVGGALVFSEPTTAQPRRTVRLPPVTLTALRAHRAAQAGEGPKARTTCHPAPVRPMALETLLGPTVHHHPVLGFREFNHSS